MLRREGNDYVVTVPDDVVERHGWREGQTLAVQFSDIEPGPVLGDDFRQAIEERWERNEEALRYLAGR